MSRGTAAGVQAEWERPKSLACRGEDRVRDRRTNGRNRRFAGAERAEITIDDDRLEQRRFIHSEHTKVMKVGLFGLAVSERDLRFEHGGERPNHAALDLRFETRAVDDAAAVDGGHDPVDADVARSTNRDVGDLGDHRFVVERVAGNASAPFATIGVLPRGCAPAGVVRGQLQDTA